MRLNGAVIVVHRALFTARQFIGKVLLSIPFFITTDENSSKKPVAVFLTETRRRRVILKPRAAQKGRALAVYFCYATVEAQI
jgi:hypothetical protein